MENKSYEWISILIGNVKNELLSFSLITILLIIIFPEPRIWIFLIYVMASFIYAAVKYKLVLNREKDIIKQFRSYLEIPNRWEKRFKSTEEYWVYKDNPLFQIETGEELVGDFEESWMRAYPDRNNNFSFKVYLKYMNPIVYDYTFVALDGVRYVVPLPKRENQSYHYVKDSLEILISHIIGQYYRYKDIKGFASSHDIKFK